jgi:hypothetical protein
MDHSGVLFAMSKSHYELFHLPNFLADVLRRLSQNKVNKIALRINFMLKHMFMQTFFVPVYLSLHYYCAILSKKIVLLNLRLWYAVDNSLLA